MQYVCVSAHTAHVMRHVCKARLTMPLATPAPCPTKSHGPVAFHKPVRFCKDGSALRLGQASSSLPPCQRQTQMYWFAGGIAKVCAASWRRRGRRPGAGALQFRVWRRASTPTLVIGGSATDVTEIRRAGRPDKVNSLGAPRPRAECAAARGLSKRRGREICIARDREIPAHPGCRCRQLGRVHRIVRLVACRLAKHRLCQPALNGSSRP